MRNGRDYSAGKCRSPKRVNVAQAGADDYIFGPAVLPVDDLDRALLAL